VDAHEVIELVWGFERLPDAPGAALHTIVARLRRTLPTGLAIVTGQHGYRLVVDDLDALDSHRFCSAIDRAQRQPDAAVRLRLLTDAIGLVRGHPYAELDHPSVAADVTRLEELELAAHELHARSLIELDRPADAVVGLQALVRRAPLRERSVALLMQALTDSGRQGDALGAYRRLRSELIEQLGIEPTAELRHLEESVLRQERSANGARATPAPAESLI